MRYRVINADGHTVEPPYIWEKYLPSRYMDRAPRLVAKGKGVLAEMIRDVARSNGIPIVEDIPLARFLHRRVKIGTLIPADTYKAVATVLAFVYRISTSSSFIDPMGAAPATPLPTILA